MDIRLILSKVLTLVYRSRSIGSCDNDELVKTVLATVKTDAPEHNFATTNVLKKLKDLTLELLEDKEAISKEVLLPRLHLMLDTDAKLYTALKESIEPDYDDSGAKRIISSLVKTLNNYYRESQASALVAKISYDIKFNRSKIGNFSDYLRNAIAELEPYTAAMTSVKDPAVVNEVDFENSESINTVFEEVRNLNNNKAVYRFGWQAFNRMTQGGIRRSGEFMVHSALQHRYKTGVNLTLFTQLAMHNAPILTEKDEGKKPLLLRISFEDSLTNNLQFIYQYLKAMDGAPVSPREFEALTSAEMTTYILERLTSTGFHIKMMRIDPSQWSYLHLFNKIIELEAQGYNVHVLWLDYITMLPTTGCTQGPAGTDKRDLVRRVRNFCTARNISVITPLQMSTEAKQMIRNGVPEHLFVKESLGKDLTADSRQISHDVDISCVSNIFTHKRKKYLCIGIDKHRLPTVIDDEDRVFMMRFPALNIPVLGDLDKEDTSFKTLPKEYDSDTSGGLLQEVLG